MQFDFEANARKIQLAVSSFNAIMLACGLLWAAAIFYGDSKSNDINRDKQIEQIFQRVAKLEGADQAMIGSVRDGQEKTNARLTTLETQNQFIMRQLDRLEAALASRSPPRP